MSQNAYAALRRLATHPAFSYRGGCLRCPVCAAEFVRVSDYDGHLPRRGRGRWRTPPSIFMRGDRGEKYGAGPTTESLRRLPTVIG